MKILVTGGAGFIGSHLVDRLTMLGHEVTVLDNLTTGDRANLGGECELMVGDIRDPSCVDKCVRGRDAIFHLAAFTSVPGSMERPAHCRDVNVKATRDLIESACLHDVKRFIFSSSSAVYPDLPDAPRPEETPPQPKSPYAESKLEGESLLHTYHRRKGISYVGLRYFNVYGPRQDAQSDYAAVIPIFISASGKNKTFTIYGDGSQTRDFVYVADVVSANLAALESDVCGIFNVGTSAAISIRELADTIVKLTGSRSRYVFEPPRPGDALTSTADISRIRAVLGWQPQWDLPAGLQHIIHASGPKLEATKR